MKITILDGSKEPGALPDYVEALNGELSARNHEMTVFQLRKMKVKYCTGCWSCWWGPTCGECITKDDSHDILRAVINSDLMIMAAPVIMGFMSAVLKQAQDKLPVLLHPYIDIVEGECRHHKRYDSYPAWGLILEKGPDTDDEDIEIINEIEQHAAKNLRSELRLSALTDKPVTEVADEIDRI